MRDLKDVSPLPDSPMQDLPGPATARLTESDRQLVARARELGPALRASASDRDRLVGWLLAELANLAERLSVPAEPEDGAIADARRTREHMARWASGADTHRGEAGP